MVHLQGVDGVEMIDMALRSIASAAGWLLRTLVRQMWVASVLCRGHAQPRGL